MQDVERREREDGSCHNAATAGTDGLDDDILAQCVLALEGTGESDTNDGDRYGGLEHLADLQT